MRVVLLAVKARERMRHLPNECMLHALDYSLHSILVIGYQPGPQLACLERRTDLVEPSDDFVDRRTLFRFILHHIVDERLHELHTMESLWNKSNKKHPRQLCVTHYALGGNLLE